ncbi:MAG TPA: tetratricopeptide repeat protein [Candidatus Acidoferrales bacterium]|nr:tetratricopeptide repeat protein [Candidatus Acidoferrales bacterium]
MIFRLVFPAFLALTAVLAGCSPAGSHALVKGKELLDQGDYSDAADEFKEATEYMATNAEAWNYLGVAEQHSGQMEEAANAYQRALDLDRDLSEAHYNLGCLWLEQNKLDDAVSEFTAYTLRRANTPEGWLKLGLAQLRTHSVLPAEKSFSTALYLSPNNAEALNGLGLARMQRDRPEEAAKFFQAAVQNHPDYAPAILNYATVEHEYLHNDRLALDEYHAYLALNPRPANWDDVNTIVNGIEQSPMLAMATPPPPRQNVETQPVRQNPVLTQPRQEQAKPVETRKPRPQESQTEVVDGDESPPIQQNYVPRNVPTQTVRVQPETPIVATPNPAPTSAPAYNNYRPVQEPEIYTSVEPNPPQSAPDYNPLHWFHSTPTQEEKVTPLPPESYPGLTPAKPIHIVQPAPPSYPSYLYLSPRKPSPGDHRAASSMFARAREFEQQRRYTDALDDYRLATREDPSWFEAQYNCGVLAYRLRDYQFSLSAYEMALAIEPGSTDARYNFALALKAAGYVPDAANELKKILATKPNDVRTHLELGNIYAQQLYDVPHAREQYMTVLHLDPTNKQASNIEFWLSANPQ